MLVFVSLSAAPKVGVRDSRSILEPVKPDDVAARVDPVRGGRGVSTGEVKRSELALAQQEAMAAGIGVACWSRKTMSPRLFLSALVRSLRLRSRSIIQFSPSLSSLLIRKA